MADPRDTITQGMIEKLIRDFDTKTSKDFTDMITGDVIVPKKYEMDEHKRRYQRDIFNEWDKVKTDTDPVTRLRKEMHDELKDIKKAINKIGIMLDSDAPTQEQMKNHKMLKEAYLKYKMIEALILGKEDK